MGHSHVKAKYDNAFLFLVAMPGEPSSFLFLVVRPGAPNRFIVLVAISLEACFVA